MRWAEQRVDRVEDGALPLAGLPGLVRTVRPPEFAGMTFHEVTAKSVLNRVPGSSPMPFRWTVNPYRGCSHACGYCYARRTHTYLDLDAGDDFDRQIVVKVNAAEVLAGEVRAKRWTREHVAMGTNTDPYQRAEGRYRLMPGIIRALGRSGTPFSILTKGTLLGRDLPELAAASADVTVGLGMSIALLDPELHRWLEPGTPGPRARLDLVRRVRDAGLPCGVFVAPVLPWLTDSTERLDELFAAIAAAGATGASALALHLKPGAREWFLARLADHRPDLLPGYERLYARGAMADPRYRRWLADRTGPLLRRHGLAPSGHRSGARGPGEEGDWPAGSMPTGAAGGGPSGPDQPTLL